MRDRPPIVSLEWHGIGTVKVMTRNETISNVVPRPRPSIPACDTLGWTLHLLRGRGENSSWCWRRISIERRQIRRKVGARVAVPTIPAFRWRYGISSKRFNIYIA